MAGSFSNYMEDRVLLHIFDFGRSPLTAASPLFLALSKADPGEDGSTINEPAVASGYHRKRVDGADFNAVVGGSLDNSGAIEFTQASIAWGGDISHFAMYNSATRNDGTMIVWGSLDTSKSIGANDTPRFAAGDLKISLD